MPSELSEIRGVSKLYNLSEVVPHQVETVSEMFYVESIHFRSKECNVHYVRSGVREKEK